MIDIWTFHTESAPIKIYINKKNFQGHDSTTSALTFALGFINDNQIIKQKCLEELNSILGEKIRND